MSELNLPATGARLNVMVTAIEAIADQCRLFTLAPVNGSRLPGFNAGAHIGIHLPDGMERQYSLIDAGEAPIAYRFAVKRDAASRGGSAWLCEQAQVGDLLAIDAPRNNFPLNESAVHSVMIAGGIGITPIRAMIARLEELGRDWSLHFATRTESEAPFASELVLHPQAHMHFDDVRGGILDIPAAITASPAGAHFYCCGPGPMLAAFEAATAAAGIAPERVHVEYFTQKFGSATDGGFTVELARTGAEVRITAGQTILDALRATGLELASSCEEGICGACETRVISGVPDHRDAILSERERQANKTMFICCSGSKGDRLVLDL